jgi:hypothetical protein
VRSEVGGRRSELRGLAAVLGLALLALPAHAAETTTVPKSTFVVDIGYLHSTVGKQWDGDRRARPLIEDIRRYEPGGGLQGVLSANPQADFDFLLFQVLYGITDDFMVGVYFPLILQTVIRTNFSWVPGDYQSGLGRSYSEDDFWAWAASMGQPRPADVATVNNPAVADMVLAARYRLPRFEFMKKAGFQWAATLQVALPTGRQPDPEAVIDTGTTAWELHSFGDVELHLTADQPFFTDEYGVSRLNVGADLYYSFLRPREFKAGKGTKNPLLNNIAPYVGETYWVDPGDWFGAGISVDVSPIYGPALATLVSGNSVEKAKTLPPLVSFTLGYTYVLTSQSNWMSNSPLWDYDREKFWQPGDKNIFKGSLTLSFLRLGLPIQVYGNFRIQDLVGGRYTRPANAFGGGVRALVKFW